MAKKSKCDKDCSSIKDYTDGIFSYCLCEARAMNTYVGAKIRPKKEKDYDHR